MAHPEDLQDFREQSEMLAPTVDVADIRRPPLVCTVRFIQRVIYMITHGH
jgi:hypothetical protein